MWKASNSCPITTRFEDFFSRVMAAALFARNVRGNLSIAANCFVELEKAFAVGSAVRVEKESAPGTPMRERYSARHQRSATGVTPKAKRIKESMFGDTAQESERTPLSKRSLGSRR